ncbi:endonuclease [Thermoplasmatales archaeon SG8-52-4]|nr:MAG: endonuclease [Thermoplasmatales archaeon SG8-52-4]
MKGSYILLINLENDQVIRIGKLGDISFNKGFYLYIGSALNGLENRLKRHFKADKKKHWHIDYFLRYGKIINAYYKESNAKEECDIVNNFENKLLSIPGFGCSDCKCKSHLFYEDNSNILNNIDLSSFLIFEDHT